MNKKLKIDNNTSLFSPSSWIENNLSKNILDDNSIVIFLIPNIFG